MLARGSSEANKPGNRGETPANSVLAEVDSEEAKIDRTPKLKSHVATLFAAIGGI
jgi:hypothetical protein